MNSSKTYKLKSTSLAKKEHDEEKKKLSEELGMAPYVGGPITSQEQLSKGLIARGKIEKLLKEFVAEGKKFVDEHGSIETDLGKWGPVSSFREQAVNMKKEELLLMAADAGMDEYSLERFKTNLERRGIGEKKEIISYRFSR